MIGGGQAVRPVARPHGKNAEDALRGACLPSPECNHGPFLPLVIRQVVKNGRGTKVPPDKESPAITDGASTRNAAAYLRAAHIMLISMPTDTSTIFGAFQAIGFSGTNSLAR